MLRIRRLLRIFLYFALIVNILVVNFKLIQAQNDHTSFVRCPEGYFLHTDELCYPRERKPCPFDKETQAYSTMSTTVATPITATLNWPTELTKLRCPPGSVMIEKKCRKVICTVGEYYRGTCLHPVCPQPLVWRGKKCQEPRYLTTVIEIDNVIANQVNEKPSALSTIHNNEVIYDTSTTAPKTFSIRSLPLVIADDTTTSTRKIFNLTNSNYSPICCKVLTPRICKLYGEKWLCSHRRHQRCDDRICSSPVVYLKAPAITYKPPILIMPPNPQLAACKSNDCRHNLNAVDCSGCVRLRPESCSPSCFRYTCPSDTCTYMDLDKYCSYYPGQNGCLPIDGCLWNWCLES